MRKDFTRYVELANKGARELGFEDNGAMWRSKYDMPPDDFAKELDRLWEQVRPAVSLAARLRAHPAAREVRRRGARQRSHSGPPAGQHVGAGLGQHLSAGRARRTPIPATTSPRCSRSSNTDWKQMVKYGEGFFVSLGFAPLPQTFWERSLFLQARATATWCATPAPGTSTTSTISA